MLYILTSNADQAHPFAASTDVEALKLRLAALYPPLSLAWRPFRTSGPHTQGEERDGLRTESFGEPYAPRTWFEIVPIEQV